MFFESQIRFIYLVTNITSPTINAAGVNINDRIVHLERSWSVITHHFHWCATLNAFIWITY